MLQNVKILVERERKKIHEKNLHAGKQEETKRERNREKRSITANILGRCGKFLLRHRLQKRDVQLFLIQ